MKQSWHLSNPVLFDKEKVEVENKHSHLHFHVVDDIVFVRGTFPIVSDGVVLDRYVVEIELPKDYPKSIPIVWEIGGRIPWTADRHMNSNGTACILLPDERWRIWPAGSTLLAFLNGPVRNYFLGQSLVERGDSWPFGQWGHGANGIHQYYAGLLDTQDIRVILTFLEYLTKKKVKGHWDCPCRSGKRLRDCHITTVQDLREKISRRDAMNSLQIIKGNGTPLSPHL